MKQPLKYVDYLLKRVEGHGAVAALRRLGAVVADVLADAVPQILCGQRHLQGPRKHGEEQHWLHGSQQRACERWSHGAGGRRFISLLFVVVAGLIVGR